MRAINKCEYIEIFTLNLKKINDCVTRNSTIFLFLNFPLNKTYLR